MKPLTEEAIVYAEELMRMKSHDSFWHFRKLINARDNFIEGKFQRDLCEHLQNFYLDWLDGKRPVLAVTAPPQHGKSHTMADFASWASGHNPNLKTYYISYSDQLSVAANKRVQEAIDHRLYKRMFTTRLSAKKEQGTSNEVHAAMKLATRTQTHLDFVGTQGYFKCTTIVGGQLTGFGFDLAIVDDPLKGHEEANSPVTKDKVWGAFQTDVWTRRSKASAILMIMTRWSHDDLIGRLQETFPNEFKLLKYPAFAEHDDSFRKAGDALFPEHKPADMLLENRKLLTSAQFESLYQQNPTPLGGGMFPVHKFFVGFPPDPKDVKKTVRYWDKAGTDKKQNPAAAFTAGVRMHEMRDGRFIIDDVIHGQWAALEREERILQAAKFDNAKRVIETWIEQEPGSGGKESAENTIRKLRGYVVKADRVTGDKVTRAQPYAAQVQGGNVGVLPDANWRRAFLDEHELFPNGKRKDQVDAAGGAFTKLTTGSTYDSTLSWVG